MLDLFTGGGGWARGFLAEKWDVVGIDILPKPRGYPVGALYVQQDVLDFDPNIYGVFDAIVASPPCQEFSALRHLNPRTRGRQPSERAWALVHRSFALARAAPLYAVENVRGAISEWQSFYGGPSNVYRPFYLWTNVRLWPTQVPRKI